MPTVGPLQGSELLQRDLKGAADVLVYLVTLSTGNIDPLHEPGLPALGSRTHPFDPTIKVDRYDVAQWTIPGSQCYVRVYYSNNGRFSLPTPPNQSDPTYRTWEESETSTILTIPRFVKKPVARGCGATGGAGSGFQLAWLPENWKAPLAVQRVSRRLNRRTFKFDERIYINSQINKFHLLNPDAPQSVNNPIWRFLGADVNELSPDNWQYVYRWETEAGNRPPPAPFPGTPEADSIILPYEYRGPFMQYQIFAPDFSGVDVCNVGAVNAARPTIRVIQPYNDLDVIPQGARNLPGNPLSD